MKIGKRNNGPFKRFGTEGRSAVSGGRNRQIIPALCNIIGTFLILAVIMTALPLTLPRLEGYKIFNVISGSMEPTLSVGSVVYARYVDPSEVNEGDVIVYNRNSTVITHRVVMNQKVEGYFVTKGDANSQADPEPVPYSEFIGVVEHHFPIIGRFYSIYSSIMGKTYAMMLAASGLLLNILAARLRFSDDLERGERADEEGNSFRKVLNGLNSDDKAEEQQENSTEE